MRNLIISALCLASLWLTGCGGSEQCAGPGGQIVGTITADQLWTQLSSATRPTIIDVRGPAAYDLGHLPGSVNDCGCPTGVAAKAFRQNLVVVGESLAHAVIAGPARLEPGEQALALDGGVPGWPYGLDISAEQLNLWLQAGRDLNLIDVRTPAEFQASHFPQSINKPLANLATWAPTLDATQEFVMICGTGNRSARARDQLMQRGLRRVHNLVGGLTAMDQPTPRPRSVRHHR